MLRWRFYREHKFVLSETARIEQLIARSDFTDNTQVMEIEKNIQDAHPEKFTVIMSNWSLP